MVGWRGGSADTLLERGGRKDWEGSRLTLKVGQIVVGGPRATEKVYGQEERQNGDHSDETRRGFTLLRGDNLQEDLYLKKDT